MLADNTLPDLEFSQPEQVRQLLGDYQLKTTVYGPDYAAVTKASNSGRHGAVVEIIPGAGSKLPPSRRFVTLYRLPDRTNFEQQAPR